MKPKYGQCELCSRETHLSFHHLIPRKAHRRKSFRKRYNRVQLQQGINLCRPCHNAVHKFYDEMYIARSLNTLEKLQSDATIKRHVRWIKKQRLAGDSGTTPNAGNASS